MSQQPSQWTRVQRDTNRVIRARWSLSDPYAKWPRVQPPPRYDVVRCRPAALTWPQRLLWAAWVLAVALLLVVLCTGCQPAPLPPELARQTQGVWWLEMLAEVLLLLAGVALTAAGLAAASQWRLRRRLAAERAAWEAPLADLEAAEARPAAITAADLRGIYTALVISSTEVCDLAQKAQRSLDRHDVEDMLRLIERQSRAMQECTAGLRRRLGQAHALHAEEKGVEG